MTRRRSTTPHSLQRTAVFILSGLLMLLFSLYIYFISASIVHVIVRKEITNEIATMNSYISDLEAEFIAAKEAISEDTIVAHGFTTGTPTKVYIEKVPTSLVVVSGGATR